MLGITLFRASGWLLGWGYRTGLSPHPSNRHLCCCCFIGQRRRDTISMLEACNC